MGETKAILWDCVTSFASKRSAVLLSLSTLIFCRLLADPTDQPVGIMLSAGGSQLVRVGTETPLASRPGDLLFVGDEVRTKDVPASFLFCPGMAIESLLPGGGLQLQTKRLRVLRGKTSEQPARGCDLPAVVHLTVASQQYYAVTMVRGAPMNFQPTSRDQLPPDVQAELAPIEARLQTDPDDPASLLAAANVFEKRKLYANELAQYYRLLQQWPDAPWVKAKIFELESSLAEQYAAANRKTTNGKTYALLVGISTYAKPELNLQFAHADAIDFGKLLATPRSGPVGADEMVLLTNEKATTAAIRNAFQAFLKQKAGKADTVMILIAGHGTVEAKGDKGAYIVTYDSDPENLKDTALALPELQKLFEEQVQNVGHVVIFVDVCNAGPIGIIKGKNPINQQIEQQLGSAGGSLTGLLAAGPSEFSFEGPAYGGGHGAFTYFVIKGMSGDADADGNHIVDARELYDYVYRHVEQSTDDKQHPREFGSFENRLRLSDITKPGIPVALWPTLRDYQYGGSLYLASDGQAPLSSDASRDVASFNAAIREGNLLSGVPGNAADVLERLRTKVSSESFFDFQNALRVALEDQAQKIILRYLAGDQNPPVKADFDQGSRYMSAARQLMRESLYLEGRESFFRGRAMLFDKTFPAAVNQLENAVRVSPASAYAYNALGIGYLEQADYINAIHAFHDASRNAPYWAYPLHNLALTYTQTGDYTAAIQAYRRAIELAPRYSYLRYNLGLLYQRLNQEKQAETAFRKAIELDPRLADAYNALGYLRESQGRAADGEQLYNQALQINSNLLAARQNLAVLISGQRDRLNEAIGLWRINLTSDPNYLASRLSLAKALTASGQTDAGVQEYKAAEQSRPDYMAVRLALMDIYEQRRDFDNAFQELNAALMLQPANPLLLERLGDLQTERQRSAEALDAYQRVLAGKIDRQTRKRVRSKIGKLRP